MEKTAQVTIIYDMFEVRITSNTRANTNSIIKVESEVNDNTKKKRFENFVMPNPFSAYCLLRGKVIPQYIFKNAGGEKLRNNFI